MFAPYSNPRIPIHPRVEDPDDIRLGAFVRAPQGPLSEVLPEIRENDFVILGYPDDRGVDRNGGRLGAADAPEEIRKYLYNMTPDPHLTRGSKPFAIWDIGSLQSWSLSLTEAHDTARKAVQQIRETGARLITLGGGHDWAFPDLIDFRHRIINIDAHLDMRPLVADPELAAHSGTPFRKILGQRTDGSGIGVIGVQKHCTARSHLEFANSHRVNCLFLEDMPWSLDKQWALITDKFALDQKDDSFALSVDMDGFPQSMAPGVSAPQSFGVDPALAVRMINHLGTRLKHLGIYELNPLFDEDGKTARLAAKLIHHFLGMGSG
ncbi:MAG: formimidoylglutamase [Bdellovibrionales bacterium]|nr:formimidoylglutamase [Bdellovibrionales bacterium]